MQKSSRFISLSGLSGIAAGVCALVAAWIAYGKMHAYRVDNSIAETGGYSFNNGYQNLERELILIAGITFIAAFWLAFLFTYLRSRKTGVPIWGFVARKVIVACGCSNAGWRALLIWRMMDYNAYQLIAPACLLFYGLGAH
jgi:hypothetical protein